MHAIIIETNKLKCWASILLSILCGGPIWMILRTSCTSTPMPKASVAKTRRRFEPCSAELICFFTYRNIYNIKNIAIISAIGYWNIINMPISKLDNVQYSYAYFQEWYYNYHHKYIYITKSMTLQSYVNFISPKNVMYMQSISMVLL
jgi:hypothetical protein